MDKDLQQEKVITAAPGVRQLVLAGPGTGKTETVARRIVHLLRNGVKPKELLVLSFSRSAVATLIRRIENVSADAREHLDDLRHVSVRTFDSWTFRALRLQQYRPADLLSHGYSRNIAHLIKEIRKHKGEDMQGLPKVVRHIIVDEFQDLSGVRGGLVLELLRRYAAPGKAGSGFTILGDDAQAIYGFGLEMEEEQEFAQLTAMRLLDEVRQTYGKELVQTELETNHRSTSEIAQLASSLRKILRGKQSAAKKLEAVENAVEDLDAAEIEASELAKLSRKGSVAILTPTNGDAIRVASKLLGNAAEKASIDLAVHTTNRNRIVPAWLGATLGPLQAGTITKTQFGRIHDHLYGGGKQENFRGMVVPTAEAAWATLCRWTDGGASGTQVDLGVLRSRLDWIDQIPDDQVEDDASVEIMTIHQSKGREFDAVLLLESEESDGESEEAEDDGDDESDPGEAANVAYVAITRARKVVTRMGREGVFPIRSGSYSYGNRRRWSWWRNGWMNMEMGIPGDVCSSSFVDLDLHGSADNVKRLQDQLAKDGPGFVGRKVVLCKHEYPVDSGHFRYRIHLQKEREPDLLLGLTEDQLTIDLLSRLHGKNHKYSLPKSIFNLRIAAITTMTARGEIPTTVAKTWAKSGLWLGAVLQGTGDFKTFK